MVLSVQSSIGGDEAQDHEKPPHIRGRGNGEQQERLSGDHQRHCQGKNGGLNDILRGENPAE